MCIIGGHQLSDYEVHKTCRRARRMSAGGRGVYIVLDNVGNLHSFLALHRPAREVLAVVGIEIVWMVDATWVMKAAA